MSRTSLMLNELPLPHMRVKGQSTVIGSLLSWNVLYSPYFVILEFCVIRERERVCF